MPSAFSSSFTDGQQITVDGKLFEYVLASNLFKNVTEGGSVIPFGINVVETSASPNQNVTVERVAGFIDFSSPEVVFSATVDSLSAPEVTITANNTLTVRVPANVTSGANKLVEITATIAGQSITASDIITINTGFAEKTQLFITATEITNSILQNAVNQLELDLVTAGILNKYFAIYPLVGNSGTSQKYNLMNAEDTNAAYRLSFTGSIAYSNYGFTPSGIAYANTNFNVSGINSSNFGMVFAQEGVDTTGTTRTYMGVSSSASSNFVVLGLLSTGSRSVALVGAASASEYQPSPSPPLSGVIAANALTGRQVSLVNNGNLIATVSNSGSLPNGSLFIGALNAISGGAQLPANREIRIAAIRESLTPSELQAEATAFSSFIQSKLAA